MWQKGLRSMEESKKQSLFVAQLKDTIEEKKKRLGRPVRYHITTMGCQMNARDSEKLSGILAEIGCEEIPTEDADILLFNTCTVRENANEKLYGHLGIVKHFKKLNPDMLIGICGCMMQERTRCSGFRRNIALWILSSARITSGSFRSCSTRSRPKISVSLIRRRSGTDSGITCRAPQNLV